jgi:hypothetical protein
MISYQGRVTDSGGTPVADGSYDMQFRIFNAATGGDQKWESGTVPVDVTDGVFDALLGESPQPLIILAFDEDYWLQVTFDGVTQSPRQRMVSVGYAYMASGLVPGTQIEEAMYGEVLHIHNLQTSGAADGIEVRTNSVDGYGVYGRADATIGSTRGVYGRAASSSGRGIVGYNAATTGDATGVHGETNSSTGRAVFGYATRTTGTNYGVYGRTPSPTGRAIFGYASSSTGVNYAGRFETTSTSGRACYGWASATTGTTYGGAFKSSSPDGYGVWGKSEAATGLYTYGVYGVCVSTQGAGVRGEAPKNGGVTGIATNTSGSTWGGKFYASESSSGTGVYGQGGYAGGTFIDSNSSGWANVGYSTYKIQGTGDVAFVQNHPAQPDRVIVYAAPEGDEVATYTRGTARLKNGEAKIPLGETFKWVTNPDIGLTAHLTPRREAIPLAVVSLTTEELVVRGPREGSLDITFDYLVYGLRIGFEERSIVQNKIEEAYIPSMADHRNLYAAFPELRRYNALERFRSMYRETGMLSTDDQSKSRALREAIQEYSPAIHEDFGTQALAAPHDGNEERQSEIDDVGMERIGEYVSPERLETR